MGKTKGNLKIQLNRSYHRVADAMGMKVSAVKQMVCLSKKCSPAKPETTNASTVFDNFTVGGIRRYIHKKFADKKHLELYDISTELKNEGLIPEQTFHTAIWRLIHTMGFKVPRYLSE